MRNDGANGSASEGGIDAAACFALLDDYQSAPDAPSSRLYTQWRRTLHCDSAAQLPALFGQMQAAQADGLHALALFDYELGHTLHGLPDTGGGAHILLFARCQRLDTAEVADWLRQTRIDTGKNAADSGASGIAAIEANVDEAQFSAALAKIRAYIEAGDIYQVNYTLRLRFDAFGDPLALYARLRARQAVPYGAFIALPDGRTVLSLSPELFIRHADGLLTARPMKGTAPAVGEDTAHGHAHENVQRAAALAADPKNRAENLMIVDLLRNDLGRVAATGSVRVPALFEVQRFGRVLQMTSTVQARLGAGATLAGVVAALFPCGSITGAPKKRAMEIIAELEPDRRGLYTGAIGYFDAAAAGEVAAFCLSVPIRTLVLQAPAHGIRRGEMGVGAGIVFDSQTGEEYAECLLKARFLTGLGNEFELFETIYAAPRAGACHLPRHLPQHLARLQASAAYFGFRYDAAALELAVQKACAALPAQAHRLRLALRADGSCTVQSATLAPLREPVGLLLAPQTTRADSLFLRHKSSVRAQYDAAWRTAEQHGAFDMLFFNERAELTEGGRSNVFVELDGRWYTPPLACGLLPGVMRANLLADPQWRACERVLTLSDLRAASRIMVCNALRGALPAHIVWPQ